jgi:HK97 gp10 family phage protein
MTVRVDITGVAELQATLSRLPGNLQEKLGVKAIFAAAKVIRDEVKARAPIRKSAAGESGKRITAGKAEMRYPGNLKAHITRRRVRKGSGTIVAYEVGPNARAWYGRLVELGTMTAGARPFMRPALDAKGAEAIETFRTVLEDGLDAVVEGSK